MSDTNNEVAAAEGQADTGKPDAAKPDAGKPAANAEAKSYTQDDIERIIQGRLAKYGDYDQIKEELDGIKAANQSDSEKAISEAKKAGEDEATTKYLTRLLQSEVKAAAAGLGFHDPADAHQYIDQEAVIGKDGEIDADALASAIAKVAESKPYLVKTAEGAPSAGDAGIGVRGGNADPGPGVQRLEAAYARK